MDRIGYRPEPVRADEPRTSRAEEERSAQRMWLRRILGLLSPIVTGAAMALSPVNVVTNSLRLRRFDR